MRVRGRLSALGAFALGLVLVLAGCASTGDPGYRDRVEHVARQASSGDLAGAMITLDALAADVSAASAAGELPGSEADRLAAAIAAVRADLVALTPPPATAPAQPSEPAVVGGDSTDTSQKGTGSGKGKGKGRPDD